MQTNIFWTLSWPFSCDYNFWLIDLKFGMCIKDPIDKTCWKNGKDLSNGAPKIQLWNHTKKTHFLVFAKNFRLPCMKLKIFFCQFPNPWTLRVSGMGGYTSKCEKKSKSLHPNVQYTVYLFTQGRWGELTREKVRWAQFIKLGRKYQHGLLFLQSINSNKHLRKVLNRQIF